VTDFAKLVLDADTKGLKQGETALKDLSKEAKHTAGVVDSTAYRMGEATGKLAKMGFLALGAAAAGAAYALFRMGKHAIDTADEITKAAQSVGIGVEELSRLKYAADLSGLSFGELQSNLGKLNRGMLEASNGTGKAGEAFQKLGISVKNSDGTLRTSTAMLEDLADVFQKMPDGVEKSALAMDVFGRSGASMIPFLNGGSAAIRELTGEADKFGIVIDEKTGRAAEQFNDNLSRLSGMFGALSMRIAAELLPHMISLQDWFIKNQDAIVGLVSSFSNLVGWVGKAADAFFRFQTNRAIALRQNTADGWFTSAAARQKALDEIAILRRSLDARNERGPRPGAFGTAGLEEFAQKTDMARIGMGGLGSAAITTSGAVKGFGGGVKAANDNTVKFTDSLQEAKAALESLKSEMRGIGIFSSGREAGVSAVNRVLAQGGPEQDMGRINQGLDDLMQKTEETRERTERGNQGIADSFRNMASDALNALDRLAGGIESGNFLSILSGVLDLGLNLAGLGAFGKSIQTKVTSLPPRANGGNVSAGQPYIVGENRPEVFIPDTNGRIQPSVGQGGGQVVVINNSALADVFVDGRIQASAPAIVTASADYTQSQMARKSTRRVA